MRTYYFLVLTPFLPYHFKCFSFSDLCCTKQLALIILENARSLAQAMFKWV